MKIKPKLHIPLIIVCVAVALWAVFAWYFQYEIIDIDLGDSLYVPKAMNDNGQITGIHIDKNKLVHAFIYDDVNGVKDISSPGDNIWAGDINNNSQVVGVFFEPNKVEHLFIWDPQNGKTDLGRCQIVIYLNRRLVKINNKGRVVGSRKKQDGYSETFIWEKETGFKLLGTLGGKDSKAFGINDKGHVVGLSQTAEGEEHAFIWDDANGMTDLGTLGGVNNGAVLCINDQDQILVTVKSVIWDREKQIQPYIFPQFSNISLCNNSGEFLGTYEKRRIIFISRFPWLDTHHFSEFIVWSEKGGLIKLPDRGNWQSSASLIDINNKGQILFQAKDGDPHVFILNPKAKP